MRIYKVSIRVCYSSQQFYAMAEEYVNPYSEWEMWTGICMDGWIAFNSTGPDVVLFFSVVGRNALDGLSQNFAYHSHEMSETCQPKVMS
ncbi:hypothetical protein CEXT_170031 [Caerostris extrusa]|uniref:Uncharacterized protein n=1 Tax=Caerostris extrusa TaxID=172846 RepID=A0AAV4XU11_CAEEX|nr:hypothetical protein CEXT_170031 [Caerostris extrusa]